MMFSCGPVVFVSAVARAMAGVAFTLPVIRSVAVRRGRGTGLSQQRAESGNRCSETDGIVFHNNPDLQLDHVP
jgi:hypothetical protein